MLLVYRPCAFALNPALDVSQYAHTGWKIREGFSKGTIVAIAQTQDGYLWLGTEFGLLRFDGVGYVPWEPPTGQHLPSSYIRSLLPARDGTLWIGAGTGLASWKGGKLTRYVELDGQSVWALLEDREGTVWAGGQAEPLARLCAIRSGKVQCYGKDGRFGQFIESLFEDRGGNLWVGGITGLWRWKPGPPKLYPMPDSVQALMEGDKGALVVAMPTGFRQLVEGKPEAYPLPATGRRFTARVILRDRDGGLWIGTKDRGLVHVHQGRTDLFERSDGLSGDFIERLFEDREGNIWVATIDGLDRFRDLAVPTISVKQGLSNAIAGSVLAARDGSVWLGTVDGLNRWEDGRMTVYRGRTGKLITGGAKGEQELRGLGTASGPASLRDVREITGSGLPDDAIESLFQDFQDQIWVSTHRGFALLENGRFTPVSSVPGGVQSIAGDSAGNLWLSQPESLFHLRGGKVVERIPWAKLGREDHARAMLADPLRGGLWLGFQRGVAYFKDGRIRASYTTADGLGDGRVRDFRLDREGTLWAATEGGVSRLKGGRFATLASKNGLPCDDVQWMVEDDDHSFWLYMACGLVRLARAELDAWVVTADKDPKRRVQATVFDASDGVRSHSTTTGYTPSFAKSTDGKLWFLPWDGVSVVDPRHIPFNRLPPPVHIQQITADRKTYNAASNVNGHLRLPPLVRDLEIDYTALSLAAPEKVLFRYKLEGWDRDWQDAGNRRQAFYTNLSPRAYRFRVSACNDSGVWNEAGASLDFFVDPAYYQTTWFRLSCGAAFLALLGALYRLRLRQVARQFNMRLEERVSERTRIARDLHDTLLQSFQGVLLKFYAVTYLLPDRPAEAGKTLEIVIEQARQAITEGRDAVQGLRSSAVVTNDLARAISTVGEGLSADQTSQNSPDFRVHVEGTPRDLAPLVRDEVYRIAGEALRNAFLHAHAKRIEVEIRYDQRQLRLRVRDNGKGIDPKVLGGGGRAGHYGLPGMHERAQLVGGKLAVWSELDSGTEAELTIPASVAYAKSPAASRWGGAARA
jgi:signal transduction histidine kinase/ligand-binding sensor domain-containing protein